jgi:signal transduction histidine kinase
MSAAFVRDQLFRPFVSTKPGGFGLGAFEARQTIEAMGGRLEVASREAPDEERGTRITLRLPAAPAWENAA